MTPNEFDAVSARFDRVAEQWDSKPERVALARAVTGAIRKTVPLRPDMNVMDFGAGTGLVTLGILPFVGRLTAVDTSAEMRRVLNEKLNALRIENVHIRPPDSDNHPLPHADFDLVVSSMVLHHLPDVPLTLRQFHSNLRAGGWIALADLDAEDGTFHSDPTGIVHNGFDRDEVGRWLQTAGFVEIRSQDAHRMERSSSDGIKRNYTVFLITGRAK
ncbi:MAG: class I SAM-dependent methyltransferase [Kiritimatiellia bacterium]|nr:class I SAM-dependent methyltransferase [Kiritimatiellia bacterium]